MSVSVAGETIYVANLAKLERRALDRRHAARLTDRDSQIRKQAMFWLGQSKDPKATKFLRDLLIP